MAANKKDYLENALLNAVLRNTTYTSPATVYLALFSSAPTESTSGTELTGNGYARQAITFGAPSNGVCTSSGAVTFTASGGAWSAVAGIAICDASSGGNQLYWDVKSISALADGDSINFASGQITVTET